MDIVLLLISTALGLAIVVYYRQQSFAANPRQLPLPPGPKPEPIVRIFRCQKS